MLNNYFPSSLPTEVLVGTVALIAGVTYWLWKSTDDGHHPEESLRFEQHGVLTPKPLENSLSEYIRDYERFCRYDGSVVGLDLVTPEHTQSAEFMYGLSTSLGMDILIHLNIQPPVVHQPMFRVVAADPSKDHHGVVVIQFFGFIGSNICGNVSGRQDLKFTDKYLFVEYMVASHEGCAKYWIGKNRPGRRYQWTRAMDGLEFLSSARRLDSIS